jgi:hypothetical protein
VPDRGLETPRQPAGGEGWGYIAHSVQRREAGSVREATTLLADARSTGSNSAGSLHAANAAALLMVIGEGDVHTAHRLLAGAIETGECLPLMDR